VVGLSRFREILSYGASLLFRLTFPIQGVRDYTCGYRAYEARIIKAAFERWKDDFISEEGFTCMVDILLKLRQMDCIFVEVPMVLRYDRKPGVSKMNVPRTIRRTLYLLVRRRLGLR
jgi:dolichol-phosphate mannosyltransferase